MTSRRFFVIGLFLLTGLAAGCFEPNRSDQPNIIIVHVDDLGWTDVASYGSNYYETPNIDRLADEGIRFTQAYAAAAVCSPSRAALMTGRYPARLGITDWIRAQFQSDAVPPGEMPAPFVELPGRSLRCPSNVPRLPLEETTIAEVLREQGYATGHIGKWHLGTEGWYPEDQGFDENAGGCDYGQPPTYFDPYHREGVGDIPGIPGRNEGEYLTDREAEEAVSFIRRHAGGPFFLYLAHYAVHTPIEAKPDVESRYARKQATNQDNPAYAAMIESVDDAMGLVLDTIDSLGLGERTIVLFTSDNGGLEPVTDNAPLRDGKGSPYEGGIRVPLIVRWPGIVEPGTESEVPAASIDYLPTLADALGLAVETEVDGVSLLPVLRGEGDPGRNELFWHFPHYRYEQVGPYSIIRRGAWKLIRYYDPEPYGVERVELFDLANDPSETVNVAAANVRLAAELEARLDEWLSEMGARMPVADS